MNLFFSAAAQANIDECGINVDEDADNLRNGTMTPVQLLTHCLDGADPDRREGWVDYVNELARAVAAADGRTHEPLTMPRSAASGAA
jgi:hypothetical protein